MAQNNQNPRNENSTLFKQLTRLFSGPIVSYDRQTARQLKRQALEKNKSRFKSLSGQEFKKSSHDPFRYLHHERLMNRNRAERYIDFDQMEYEPIISSALDIYSDEITTSTGLNDVLQIECDNERIRSILRTLYYDILNVKHNLFGWTRTMCKYGDFFLYLDVDQEAGVTNVIGLPTQEVERMDGQDETNPNYTQFQWNSAGMTFERWQIAHFRILGNDKYTPYGTCLPFATNVETPTGLKEIQNIAVGDEVFSFDEESGKKVVTEVQDKVCNGIKEVKEIRTDHRMVKATNEHKFLVYNKSKDEYSYRKVEDLEEGDCLVQSKKIELDKEKNIPKQLPEDNHGSYFQKYLFAIPDKVTPEFARFLGFMLGDGWFQEKRPSQVGFALGVDNPQNWNYIKALAKFSGKSIDDLQFHDCEDTKREDSAREFNSVRSHSKMLAVILRRLGLKKGAHNKRIPKWLYGCSQEVRKEFLYGLQDADGSSHTDKWDCTRYTLEMCNEDLIKDVKALCNSIGIKSGKISHRKRPSRTIEATGQKIGPTESYKITYYDSQNTQMKKYKPEKYKMGEEDYIIEPIRSIEEAGKDEVYDIHVEGNNKKYNNCYANGVVVHNSVLENSRRIWRQLVLIEDAVMAYRIVRSPERRVFYIDVGGIEPDQVEEFIQKTVTEFKRHSVIDEDAGQVDLRYDPMSIEEDYYIPVRGGESQTRIEKLQGGEYTGDIDDVEYLKDKLLTALKIPQPYLTRGKDGSEDQSTLAQKDIRFARTIQRLQRVVVSELRKIGVVHLHTLGFTGEDLMSFKLKLNNPSQIAEMQQLEHWRTKLDVGSQMRDQGTFSEWYVAENVYGMSEDEFVRNRREKKGDAKYNKDLTNIEEGEEGMGDELGGGLGGAEELEGFGDKGEEPFGGEEEPADEGTLLSAPEGGGGGEEPAKRDDEAYETPRSKGKKYKPEASDKRNMGARKRSHMSKGGSQQKAKSRRKKIPGLSGLDSISSGIYERQEKERQNKRKKILSEDITQTEDSISSLIKSLEDNEEIELIEEENDKDET